MDFMDLDILDPAFAGDTSCAGQFGRCMAFLPKTPSSASFSKTGILIYFGHRSRTFWTPSELIIFTLPILPLLWPHSGFPAAGL
jgi:hypothetical protein